MRIVTREKDGVVILDLQGKLMGGPDAEVFKATIHKLLEAGRKKVVVNLHDIDWINSTGMGILISGYTTMRRSGGDLRLLNVSDKIQSILYVTKLNMIFKCYGDENEAVESFETP
ncbi:MAG: anti-sigma factor antagonist [Candidatus Latescibacterota bacterium]|jgi:anti-sigma B factor antagonist|nr:MAG: anti-sigma factor antagonist [Candidatus Latescibacterota bacterium]